MSTKARPHRELRGTAQDYAAAIYDLAFETWTQQLGGVHKAVKTDASLRAALDDPTSSIPDKLRLLGQALPEGPSQDVRKFLGALLEAGQIDQLDAILAEFERLVSRHPERKLARVTSAVALTDAEKANLRTNLTDRFGADLEFEFNVDSSLLGGIYLRVGDQVIDGTVAGKLAALRDRLAA